MTQLHSGARVRLLFGGPTLEVVEHLVDEHDPANGCVLCLEMNRQAESVYIVRVI